MPATQTVPHQQNPVIPAPVARIVLIGFMGAGKSTVGRILAEDLGWQFLDLDQHIEQRTQNTIPGLFAQHGEPHFRRLESAALASVLALPSTVIALGGGTPELHTNRLILEQTPATVTIFLDAPFPTLFDRCVLQAVDRPVLHDPALAEARFALRLPLYRRVARITQQTQDLSAAETANALCQALALLP